MSRCALPACGTKVRRGLLMCGPHWARIPAHIQRAVHRAWKACCKEGITAENWGAYQAIVRDAVAAVEADLTTAGAPEPLL